MKTLSEDLRSFRVPVAGFWLDKLLYLQYV